MTGWLAGEAPHSRSLSRGAGGRYSEVGRARKLLGERLDPRGDFCVEVKSLGCTVGRVWDGQQLVAWDLILYMANRCWVQFCALCKAERH